MFQASLAYRQGTHSAHAEYVKRLFCTKNVLPGDGPFVGSDFFKYKSRVLCVCVCVCACVRVRAMCNNISITSGDITTF
jgi:hypothetical protein